MSRALLIIDVTDFYLNQHRGVVDIPIFIQNIVHRVVNGNDDLVVFFTDFITAKFPNEFAELLAKYGPAKYKTAFSAFDFDPTESELYELLQENGVDELEVCGLYANWCVADTVQDALKLGYKVNLNPTIILGENGKIRPDLSHWNKLGAMVISPMKIAV